MRRSPRIRILSMDIAVATMMAAMTTMMIATAMIIVVAANMKNTNMVIAVAVLANPVMFIT